MTRLAAALSIWLLLAGACGSGDSGHGGAAADTVTLATVAPVSAEGLAGCTPETLAYLNDPDIVVDRMIGPSFGTNVDWVALAPSDIAAIDPELTPGGDYTRLTAFPEAAVALKGDVPERVRIRSLTWERAQAAADAGHDIWLRVTPSDTAGTTIAVSPDGSVAFVGDCVFDIFTKPFRRYHTHLAETGDRRSQADLALDMITDSEEERLFSVFLTPGMGTNGGS